MITKLGMVILLEHDLEAAVSFYKKMGLKLVFHIKDSWAEFALGLLKIGLCPTSKPVQERVTGLVFEVADLKNFYEQFKETVPFKSAPEEKVHGIMASMQDPGGNIIDLYEPTPERVHELVKEVVERDREEGSSCCGRPRCGCVGKA